MIKEKKPVAVCTACGHHTFRAEAINQQCSARPGGKRCKGAYGSALGEGDWAQCPSCGGSGEAKAGPCVPCQGDGWVYVR